MNTLLLYYYVSSERRIEIVESKFTISIISLWYFNILLQLFCQSKGSKMKFFFLYQRHVDLLLHYSMVVYKKNNNNNSVLYLDEHCILSTMNGLFWFLYCLSKKGNVMFLVCLSMHVKQVHSFKYFQKLRYFCKS